MIYLDNGATSFHKPPGVYRAVLQAMERCANPGRGGHAAGRYQTLEGSAPPANRFFPVFL